MNEGTRTERLVCGYLTAIPVLWVLGLTLPVAFALFGWLALRLRSRRALMAAWPWLAVGAWQLVSVLVNMAHEEQPPVRLLKHLAASYVSGWFLIAAAVAIGASGAVRAEPFVRAVVRLGRYCVGAAVIFYPLALLSGAPTLLLRSPLGFFVPDDLPAARFTFSMTLFVWEGLFGVALPRLAMFHPWATALAFSGFGMFFVSMNATTPALRRAGRACALFMVVAAMGRAAMAALLLCAALRWVLGRARVAPIPVACAAVAVGCAAAITVLLVGLRPSDLRVAVGETRPGATAARELVERRSWMALEDAPLLGHGWTGRPVYPRAYRAGRTMVLGSHSTVSGLLYLGGVVTFAAFVVAMLYTAILLAVSRGDPPVARNTFALLAGIGIIATTESLHALALSSVFVFVWIGIAIARCWPESAQAQAPLRQAA